MPFLVGCVFCHSCRNYILMATHSKDRGRRWSNRFFRKFQSRRFIHLRPLLFLYLLLPFLTHLLGLRPIPILTLAALTLIHVSRHLTKTTLSCQFEHRLWSGQPLPLLSYLPSLLCPTVALCAIKPHQIDLINPSHAHVRELSLIMPGRRITAGMNQNKELSMNCGR